jgi:hypothetical protein
MSDSSEKIRRQMRDIRRGMGVEMQDLVQSAQQLSDWRYYVRKFPWICVGSAFVAGVLLSPKSRKFSAAAGQKADWDKLIAQLKQTNLGAEMHGSPLTNGLLGRALALAAPILARSATNYIATHMGIASKQNVRDEGEEYGQTFESLGKPR